MKGGNRPLRDYDYPYLNQPSDVSEEFARQENHFFVAMGLDEFDPEGATGTIRWDRYTLRQRMSFNQVTPLLEKTSWGEMGSSFEDDKYAEEFPTGEYEKDHVLPFSLTFVSPRTVRLRLTTRPGPIRDESSLMLDGEPVTSDSWKVSDDGSCTTYRSNYGSVVVEHDPWHLEFRDAAGGPLTRTQHLFDSRCLINSDPTPFSFVRTASDLTRRIAASFSLQPDEKLFGCGESFTRLDKRGQKIPLWTLDAHSAQTPDMYKPIPFFMSSAGYSMFVHTSAPMTFDLGCSYDGANIIYLGDEQLDLFVLLGSPKEILSEYTALTGRSPVPPLWSFGLWMSRISYKSEEEVRDVAKKLRENEIPCDVIHLDTGWFEEDWRCDYEFSTSRFEDPGRMISDLKEQGFRVSLWQLPYFTPKNKLYAEIGERGYAVLDTDGRPPTEDAVIDFSNPEAVRWYKHKLANLLEMGVSAIKVDFGEAAPLRGAYTSGKSGFFEHNLYPLRYNRAAAEVTKETTGESVIWARSAWAGSQRYPLHWGGDAENTDSAMAASLRAGLSIGLCGFSFWSHDIGGFPYRCPENLYRRWMPFGMLTSHSRCHGVPPTEPWEYGESFTSDFRRAVELKYRLMPYIYAQAKLCSESGYPMMRSLFFEYPEDPPSWLVEDEYLFGDSILVAPLMKEASDRKVYTPPGMWIDYQIGRVYEGGSWHHMEVGEIPAVVLVKDGTVIPHIRLAQSSDQMVWTELELVVFNTEASEAHGVVCLPGDDVRHTVRVDCTNNSLSLVGNEFEGAVPWTLYRGPVNRDPK
jgi:alpha-D-xyloside xylohydrolase